MNIRDAIKQSLGATLLAWQEYSPRRVYFTIDKKDIVGVVKLLVRELHLRFATASGTQTKEGFEIVYHFSVDKNPEIYSARVIINEKEKPEIDSITPLFPAAEWIEREMWELLGIHFKGHPNLKRLLLPDTWPDGEYPLRHDHDHGHDHGHSHGEEHEGGRHHAS